MGLPAYRLGAVAAVSLACLGLGSSASHGRPAPIHSAHNEHYCDGCIPPLLYDGGPVADTSGPDGLTVIPVFWVPAGYSYVPSNAAYTRIVSQYVANLEAASGTTGDVYSIAGEYYGLKAAKRVYLRYRITAGEPVIDTHPFPARKCPLAYSDYRTCVTDAQLRAELARVIQENDLPTGLSAFYPVFFPNAVQTQDLDGSNSADGYCGYHRSFGRGAGVVLYGNEPLELAGCDAGQAPNGSVAVDATIDTLSHELLEVMTDPTGTAWGDSSGSEIADICAGFYGTPLGSTDPGNPGHTAYNQAIGNGRYYTQSEFSNAAYAKFGVGNGCQLRARDVGRPPIGRATGITLQSQVVPDFALPADGKATTHDNVFVTDRQGFGIAGDTITLSTYLIDGTGTCGALSKASAKTGADGSIDVVYRASTSNGICGITATEAKGGKTVTAPIYQGTFRRFAPTATDTFPETMGAGTTAVAAVTYGNRTADPIPFGTVNLSIFPDGNSSPKISPKWIAVAASTRGRGGPFRPISLKGFDDGHLEGRVLGPDGTGLTIPAHRKVTVFFRFTLAPGAPSRGQTPVFDLEAFLDQLNPATGTFTTLADTGFTGVAVSPR